jgi:hypothetical protein
MSAKRNDVNVNPVQEAQPASLVMRTRDKKFGLRDWALILKTVNLCLFGKVYSKPFFFLLSASMPCDFLLYYVEDLFVLTWGYICQYKELYWKRKELAKLL